MAYRAVVLDCGEYIRACGAVVTACEGCGAILVPLLGTLGACRGSFRRDSYSYLLGHWYRYLGSLLHLLGFVDAYRSVVVGVQGVRGGGPTGEWGAVEEVCVCVS